MRPRGRWRRFVLFLKRHRWGLLGSLPLGVGVPMISLMASLGPDEVSKNLAKWPSKLGWEELAGWLERYATGPRVFWATITVSVVYGAIVWGIPALIYRTRKQTAVILVPLATLFIVACVGVGGFLIGRQEVDWQLRSSQRRDLLDALNAAPERFPFMITTVPAAPSDAVRLGYDFMHVVNQATGWAVVLRTVGDPEFYPEYTGLIIAFKINTNPDENRKAKLLRAIFGVTGFRVHYLGHHNFPAEEAMLVIGKRP
jgi:hypothetical protein